MDKEDTGQKVMVCQKSGIMNGVIGYQDNRSPNPKKVWYECVWGKIVIGIIITIVGGLALNWLL